MRPPDYHRSPDLRPARGLLIGLAILFAVGIGAIQSISFYVESLWYGSLGFQSVFWYRLKAQSAVFVAVAAVSAIVLWLIFRIVTPPPSYSRRPFLQFGNEAIIIPTTETLKKMALP